MKGIHRINKGEIIRVEYYLDTCDNTVLKYDILSKGDSIYSCRVDYIDTI